MGNMDTSIFVEACASPITTHQVSACTTPKTLLAALNTLDATKWATTYDEELDQHQRQLGAGRLEPKLPGDTPRRPLFKFTQNTNSDRTASRKKVRCAIRGDTMVPGVEYNSEKTSAQTPSYTSLRLLVALTAANRAVMESWDVPGAYLQADADHNYRQTMIQPPRSDGSYEAPGQICAIKKAMQGASDAGQLWARHRNAKFHSWGWTTVPCEPAPFVINHRKAWARLIANTDDFAVSVSSQSYLNNIRVPFENEWKITMQRFTAENPII
jgi:Reverse transcriptase (RNA-dependent DNA polymerase)